MGLKGTDGLALEARCKGAKALAPERARATLCLLVKEADNLVFFTGSNEMGENVLKECGLNHFVVYEAPEESSSKDTKATCDAFLEKGVDFILFCGGDGTARDVASVADQVPILGIPSGVKMYSGVFAISPQAAAELALGYARGELLTRETEIVDVDEELYRSGELHTRLYATARTPYMPVLVQERKRIYSSDKRGRVQGPNSTFCRRIYERRLGLYLGRRNHDQQDCGASWYREDITRR